MRAGDRFKQRALAGAIGTDQAVERAGLHHQVNAVQRAQRSIDLGDGGNLQQHHQRAPRGTPKEPMRSRADTISPSSPVGWNMTTTSNTTPRITGQNWRMIAVSAST